ncbi:unnamed protein product [Auanema sp. JU1783]|nr:unnamed protein product [Auanema sp. JU1783]
MLLTFERPLVLPQKENLASHELMPKRFRNVSTPFYPPSTTVKAVELPPPFVSFVENVIATKYTLLVIWFTIILIFAVVALKRNRVWPSRRHTYQRAFL